MQKDLPKIVQARPDDARRHAVPIRQAVIEAHEERNEHNEAEKQQRRSDKY